MPKQNSRLNKLSRREFIRFTGGFVGAGAIYFLLKSKPTKAAVRPPGAVPAGDFEALCVRCGRCLAACDQCGRNAIRLDVEGLPYIDGLQGWCDFCMLCGEICPSGALLQVNPDSTVIGLAVINRDRCIPWVSSGCRLCYEECINLQNAIWIDDDLRPYVDESLCNGCGACVTICPQSGAVGQSKRDSRAVRLIPISEFPYGTS
jgi:MinD superfamily P-loop ATPase